MGCFSSYATTNSPSCTGRPHSNPSLRQVTYTQTAVDLTDKAVEQKGGLAHSHLSATAHGARAAPCVETKPWSSTCDPEQSTGGAAHTEPPWGLCSVRLSQDGSCPPLGVGRNTWSLLERLTRLHLPEKSLPSIWGIS